MKRHHFWITGLICSITALMATSCVAPPLRAAGVQRAPSATQDLAPDRAAQAANASTNQAEDAATAIPAKTVKVGLLLPLSGRQASLGKALQDAATLSLFDKYARLSLRQQVVRVELLAKDTGDSPEQAARAMQEALNEGAAFIIGPLFADGVASSAPLAQAKNISILSLSNNAAKANAGIYTFGFSPAEQTERIVNYAIQSGKKRIAVLAPNSALGEAVLTAARATAHAQGLTLAAEAKYLPQGANMGATLDSLILAGRTPNFDALLIPEGGPALETILRGLNARGVKPSNVKFLGTGLWDDADLLRRVNLDGAWFASSPPALTSQFEQRFRSTYSYAPPRIASLTYDAVALAVALATSGREFNTAALTSPAGFAGPANGIFRLRSNGTTQRGLAVMEAQPAGGLKIIAPAPTGF